VIQELDELFLELVVSTCDQAHYTLRPFANHPIVIYLVCRDSLGLVVNERTLCRSKLSYF